jgi:hypothetical protein
MLSVADSFTLSTRLVSPIFCWTAYRQVSCGILFILSKAKLLTWLCGTSFWNLVLTCFVLAHHPPHQHLINLQVCLSASLMPLTNCPFLSVPTPRISWMLIVLLLEPCNSFLWDLLSLLFICDINIHVLDTE